MGGMVGYGGRDGTLSAFSLVRLHYAAQRPGVQLPRARCTRRLQKSNDLAREAVSCNTVFGAPVANLPLASRMCRPHPHGITPAQRASILNHARKESRVAQRASI